MSTVLYLLNSKAKFEILSKDAGMKITDFPLPIICEMHRNSKKKSHETAKLTEQNCMLQNLGGKKMLLKKSSGIDWPGS